MIARAYTRLKNFMKDYFIVLVFLFVFDYHHHTFCTGDLTEKQALELAISTWGQIKPVVHYSESRAEEKKDPKIRAHAHSDYVNGPVDDYGYDLDVMIEAKAKELAPCSDFKKMTLHA